MSKVISRELKLGTNESIIDNSLQNIKQEAEVTKAGEDRYQLRPDSECNYSDE